MSADIKTPRLDLRPLHRGDAPGIAAKLNSYEISKYLARVPYPYGLEDAEEFLDWSSALDHRSAFRGICLKDETENLIGVISYDWNEAAGHAELGYWLVREHWGKGFMTEASRAMVNHAFTVSELKALSSCFFNENPASGRVLSRAGFEITGTCQQFSLARGHDVPVTNMLLTKARWEKEKAAPQGTASV